MMMVWAPEEQCLYCWVHMWIQFVNKTNWHQKFHRCRQSNAEAVTSLNCSKRKISLTSFYQKLPGFISWSSVSCGDRACQTAYLWQSIFFHSLQISLIWYVMLQYFSNVLFLYFHISDFFDFVFISFSLFSDSSQYFLSGCKRELTRYSELYHKMEKKC